LDSIIVFIIFLLLIQLLKMYNIRETYFAIKAAEKNGMRTTDRKYGEIKNPAMPD